MNNFGAKISQFPIVNTSSIDFSDKKYFFPVLEQNGTVYKNKLMDVYKPQINYITQSYFITNSIEYVTESYTEIVNVTQSIINTGITNYQSTQSIYNGQIDIIQITSSVYNAFTTNSFYFNDINNLSITQSYTQSIIYISYDGLVGPSGSQGPQGPQGPAGPPGNGSLSGPWILTLHSSSYSDNLCFNITLGTLNGSSDDINDSSDSTPITNSSPIFCIDVTGSWDVYLIIKRDVSSDPPLAVEIDDGAYIDYGTLPSNTTSSFHVLLGILNINDISGSLVSNYTRTEFNNIGYRACRSAGSRLITDHTIWGV